jgi:lysine-ketoglutarate reductase/saccharopine dehydrogenase-like protein (TIGR00300 family)
MAEIASIVIEGHLIDSGTLSHLFDRVIQAGATYEVLEFRIGRRNDETSTARLALHAPDAATLEELLENLVDLGARPTDAGEATTEEAPSDGVVPEDFYSTTNHATSVRSGGRWIPVERQRMDSVIVLRDGTAVCTKLRDVRTGDPVVVGMEGIRVEPPPKERDRAHFGFMSNDVSSERNLQLVVERVARDMAEAKAAGRRVVIVSGPVPVHTGGVDAFEALLAGGHVDALLAGNALAVHDIERAMYNTSLGIDAGTGEAVQDGHRNHMRAINAIRAAGSIARAVEQGVLTRGIMYRAVESGVPFVLAGSLRDDGPLPDVVTDMNEAQERYSEALRGAGVVLILSTMLHGIAVGNMIPSDVVTVCVDINPAVATKLADRGSSQALGVVTDVGHFLQLLARRLT